MKGGIVGIVLFAMWIFSPDKGILGWLVCFCLFLLNYHGAKMSLKLFFRDVFYWMTVCALMVYGVFFGTHLIELTSTPDTFIYTTYLALFATFVYCGGILLTVRKVKVANITLLVNELLNYSSKKLLLAYCLYSLFSSLFSRIVLHLGGLSKWALLSFG